MIVKNKLLEIFTDKKRSLSCFKSSKQCTPVMNKENIILSFIN